MESMQELMKHSEKMEAWMDTKKDEFDQLPESYGILDLYPIA